MKNRKKYLFELHKGTVFKPTEFKYVQETIQKGVIRYYMNVKIGRHGKRECKYFNEIRECAIAVDVYLISNGKNPVNILKPKTEQKNTLPHS